MDFASLKKNRNQLQDKLKEKVEALASKDYKDERFWKVTTDKSGNGNALLRFLWAPKGEDFPFVKFFSHTFKGPGGWYIQNCPTTLGRNCPVCEANNALWNSEIEANKEIARKRKRKLNYVSNILVIKDPAVSDNNGKVFLFKYGQKIFEKINDLLYPQIEGDESVNPFDFWDGCNFKLRATKQQEYPNYDKSLFESPSPLFGGDDAKIEAVWNLEYPISPFVDPKEFKDYDELAKLFNKVVGNVAGKRTATAAEADEEEAPAPRRRTASPRKQEEAPAEEEDVDSPPFEEDEDAESIMKRFQQLADQE